jgi:hypothetical protein
MSPIDGIAATRTIVERHPGTAVNVMSADGIDEPLLAGSGAMGFVRKQDLSPRRLRQLWADGCRDRPAGAAGATHMSSDDAAVCLSRRTASQWSSRSIRVVADRGVYSPAISYER